jgi:hypothetical protein
LHLRLIPTTQSIKIAHGPKSPRYFSITWSVPYILRRFGGAGWAEKCPHKALRGLLSPFKKVK